MSVSGMLILWFLNDEDDVKLCTSSNGVLWKNIGPLANQSVYRFIDRTAVAGSRPALIGDDRVLDRAADVLQAVSGDGGLGHGPL